MTEEIEADEGYMRVQVKQPAPLPPLEVLIDLFEAGNAYYYIHAEHANVIDRGNAWVEWLKGKGLPPLSHGAAFALTGKIQAAMGEFAKKKPGFVSESADSPDSTASPPSS